MTADISIHRLLDEAFAGASMTPELQDLKEELRGSLTVRVAELRGAGTDDATAATTAMREIGDVRALIAAVSDDGTAPGAERAPDVAAAAELVRLHRVKPAPAYVLRTVLLALVVAGAVALLTLGALQVLGGIAGGAVGGVGLAVVLGLAVGVLTADGLRRETTVHFPAPRPRAIAWGAAGGSLATGAGLGAVAVAHLEEIGILIAAIVLALAGILGLVWCGVTQTNRTKPWALAMGRQAMIDDRFTQDPAAAARFGIYTVVVWVLGIAAFVVLSLTVGFAWSWLAIVAAIAVFFLVLARMNFPGGSGRGRSTP